MNRGTLFLLCALASASAVAAPRTPAPTWVQQQALMRTQSDLSQVQTQRLSLMQKRQDLSEKMESLDKMGSITNQFNMKNKTKVVAERKKSIQAEIAQIDTELKRLNKRHADLQTQLKIKR